MRTAWEEKGEQKSVTAPVSLVVSAFAPVGDVRDTLTPQLRLDEDSTLVLIDLGRGKNRLGGSVLAQCWGKLGSEVPDVSADDVRALFDLVTAARSRGLLKAYHDRSDGGLLVTLLEMAFAARCGLTVDIASDGADAIAELFAEEIGAVVQVAASRLHELQTLASDYGLRDCLKVVATPRLDERIVVSTPKFELVDSRRGALQQMWSRVSHGIARLRDNTECADQEYDAIVASDPGLSANLTFKCDEDTAAPMIATGVRPRVAILREQGVNGQLEMAAAFDRAGFTAVDVHMSDLLAGETSLSGFHGLAACGGFSYGDVLGAGEGWAKSILFHEEVRAQFSAYFNRADTFALGVCNGCQMLSALQELIPGANHWPRFAKNTSEQYEALLALVRVEPSPSIMMSGMVGSHLPIVVAHGEGRAQFESNAALETADQSGTVALRYLANDLSVAQQYPANPNGSPAGMAGLCSNDGRVTIMMPHPERVYRASQLSWAPEDWREDSGWMRLFRNARVWLG